MLSRFKFRKSLLICFAITLFPITPLMAQPPAAANVQLAEAEITISQAVDIVRRATGGHVLSAKRVNAAEPIYVIKVLLPSGQVKSYRVSAKSGKIL
jgi:uncharacterized membrane protein YkoI